MAQIVQALPPVQVFDGETELAWIFRRDYEPEHTEFPTPDSFTLQVGYVVYPAGGEVVPHRHLPVERRLAATCEVLFVKKGCAAADFYGEDGHVVATHVVGEGDVVLLIAGGHGFRTLEDTIFIEVKQGPYYGADEKEML